jgi:hypothetical protein
MQVSAGHAEETTPPPDASEVLDTDAVRVEVQDEFGDRYAGDFVHDDVDGHEELVVAIEDATTIDANDLADIADPDAARALDARYSWEELDAYQDTVLQILFSSGAAPDFALGKSLEDPTSDTPIVVELTVNGLAPEVRAQIEAAVPGDALRIVPGGTVEQANATRFSFPPYQAGLSAQIVNPSSWSQYKQCSSGFTLVNAYGYFGTTAGHCSFTASTSGPDPVYMGPSLYGSGAVSVDSIRNNAYYSQLWTYADALSYSLSAGGFPVTAQVMTGAYAHRTVTSRYTSSPPIGTSLCFDGVASAGGNCGALRRVDVVATLGDGKLIVDAECFDSNDDADSGDSGAPVYKVNGDGTARAAGLVFGSITVSGASGGRETCYSHIDNVVDLLGAEVLTS